ncbi:MAG: Hsp20/alpha crystallin family protein [Betaproteobacteria bacterium]|jgi:HSP20 family protein
MPSPANPTWQAGIIVIEPLQEEHMNNLTRFDPFKDFPRLGGFADIEDLWRTPFPRALMRGMPQEPEIKLDVTENDKAYTVKADVPGVAKEDIKVSIDGNYVSISAEVKREKEEKKGETVVRSERYYGKQSRSFTLESDIDDAKADASYANGVLTLTLPKKEGSSVRQVTVK